MAEAEIQKKTAGGAAVGKAEGSSSAIAVSHIALARKYRPTVFDELIGQDAMVQTLANAFATGRIAQSYMLTGVRGVGKTTTARLIARALNYEPEHGGGGPTLEMPEEGVHCRAIIESRHLDVIEMDAASHTGIDDIRELIDSAHYKPNTARYKVYIIDEVHMLSKQAFNGLLKTLEEPPEHVKFIFATTEVRKVPVTVLSRCQRFDLRRIDAQLLTEHLASITAKEGAQADGEALALIARSAEGSVRDALSILDRAIAFSSGKVEMDSLRGLLGLADRGRIFDLLERLFAGEAGKALQELAALIRDGAEPGQVITDLSEAVHSVTLAKAAGPEGLDLAIGEAERARAIDLAARLEMPALARAWQMLLKGHDEVRASPRPHAAADMVLVRLAYAANLPPPGDLLRRLRDGAGSSAEASNGGGSRDTGLQQPARPEASTSASASNDDPETEAPAPELNSFEDVIALAKAKRDRKLQHALVEQVRLVRFRPGNMEFNVLPAAPKDLATELARKLKAWTGRVWIVVLSTEEGAPPLGLQRRERDASEIEAVREHPAVKEVLEHFPDARILSVRPTESKAAKPDESSDEVAERFTEDGTNS